MKILKSILNQIFDYLIVAFVIITLVSVGINLSVEQKDRYNVFEENNKYGISKTKLFPFNHILQDKIIVTAKYDSINDDSYPFFIAFANKKCGIINKKDQVLLSFIHDNIALYLITEKKVEFEICNNITCGKSESYILGFQYTEHSFKSVNFYRYIFNVKSNQIEINLNNGQIIHVKEVLPLHNDILEPIFFIYDGKYKLYDYERNKILFGSNNVFDSISFGCTGQTYVCKDKKWGVLNTKGLTVNIERSYENIEGSYELPANFAVCIYNQDTIIRDIYTGDTINYIFSSPTNNFLGAKDPYVSKWGFLDCGSCVNITGFIYDSITPYTEIYEVLIDKYLLLAAVKKDNNWGWINEFGHTIIPFIYNEVEEFNNKYENVAKVQTGKESFYIDIFRNKKDTSD